MLFALKETANIKIYCIVFHDFIDSIAELPVCTLFLRVDGLGTPPKRHRGLRPAIPHPCTEYGFANGKCTDRTKMGDPASSAG